MPTTSARVTIAALTDWPGIKFTVSSNEGPQAIGSARIATVATALLKAVKRVRAMEAQKVITVFASTRSIAITVKVVETVTLLFIVCPAWPGKEVMSL